MPRGRPKKQVQQVVFEMKQSQEIQNLIKEMIEENNIDTGTAKLCGLIDRCTDFNVVIIPTQTNSLGVSQICTLSDEVEGFSVGYNVKADFELSALGDGDLDIPALNQQEGTFTNIDK